MTRCPAALWLARHDLRWTQRRDAAGRAVAPHTLIWTFPRGRRGRSGTDNRWRRAQYLEGRCVRQAGHSRVTIPVLWAILLV